MEAACFEQESAVMFYTLTLYQRWCTCLVDTMDSVLSMTMKWNISPHLPWVWRSGLESQLSSSVYTVW